MRRAPIFFLVALSVATQPALAAEKAPVSLKRVSKWEIKYEEDACNVLAEFGAGDDAVALSISRITPGDWFEMRLYGKMVSYDRILMPFEVSFGDNAPLKRTAMSATSGGDKKVPAAIVPNLRIDGWDPAPKMREDAVAPIITEEQETKTRSITFKPARKGRYLLETGSLRVPFAAMRTCTDDLLKHWGYDPAVDAKLTRRPTPLTKPESWLGTNDFPAGALAQGMNGYIKFRLDVDPAGNVAGCRILYRTSPDEFADASCKFVSRRAKFQPALDAAGAPVKSYYVNSIRWLSANP